MELKEGMLVRTKFGYICKIININEFREPSLKYGVDANYLKDIMFIGDDDIKKSSSDIIDLIEVGDYVNGRKVREIFELDKTYIQFAYDYNKMYTEDYIKSIVTHEQMETMKYEVE